MLATTISPVSISSPSSKPNASQSPSGLSSGAIAGIVIAAVVAVSCLVGFLAFGILRARRRQGKEATAMAPMNQYGVSEIGKGSMKVELDGQGRIIEMPSQDLRQEMSG